MRTKWILAAMTAGACATFAASAGLASADDTESAEEVISKLQSEGYNVTIDKIGTAPMSECVVTSVRNPQQFTQLVPLLGGGTTAAACCSRRSSVSRSRCRWTAPAERLGKTKARPDHSGRAWRTVSASNQR